MITVDNLVYEYPDKRALHSVSLEIKAGDICALVGPNGAGKTTLLRNLAALEIPFSGEVTIDGMKTHDDPREIHKKVGYLSDFFGLYDDLTIEQNLTYMAWCHKVDPAEIVPTIEWTISKLGLSKFKDKKAGDLSRGLRQRLAIAQAILHRPKVLLLDEPASGLDPDARNKLSGLLKSLQAMGITIIVSSHILAELEDYCTSMLVIENGRILDHVQLDNVQADDKHTLTIGVTSMDNKFLELLNDQDNISDAQHVKKAEKDWLQCQFIGDDEQIHTLLSLLLKKKVPVCHISLQTKTLQQAYKDLSAKSKSTANTDMA